MTTPARKRLMRDFKRLSQDPPDGVNASPHPDNIMQWNAVIFGPEDTVWDGGVFKLTMEFSEDYPNKAPVVKFRTRMFHPNIYGDGGICLDILQNQWSPIYDVSAILTSIQSLLSDPNPNSPANSEAARLFNENRREYNKRVQAVVEASWVDDGDDGDEDDDDYPPPPPPPNSNPTWPRFVLAATQAAPGFVKTLRPGDVYYCNFFMLSWTPRVRRFLLVAGCRRTFGQAGGRQEFLCNVGIARCI